MELLQQPGSGSVVLSLLGGLLLFGLERAAIGPDRTLMIVRTGERVWLLGVTPQCIQPIGELDPADYPEEAPNPAAAAGRDFSAALQSAVKGWTEGRQQGQQDENS